MSSYETISRYLYNKLSTILDIPVYNNIQENKQNSKYCVFFILDGTPTKYIANNTAFTEFDIRINIWSPNSYEYDDLESIISQMDGEQAITITNGNDTGFILSVRYTRQNSMVDDGWFGLQVEFAIRTQDITI